MLTDEKFMERAKKFMLFKATSGACMTYEELIAAVGETQKDKNGKVTKIALDKLKELHLTLY